MVSAYFVELCNSSLLAARCSGSATGSPCVVRARQVLARPHRTSTDCDPCPVLCWMCRVGDSLAFGRTHSMLLQLLLRPD
jgi:hypothetical protein